MSNPNKTFKAQHAKSLVDTILEKGEMEIQLDFGDEQHSLKLDVIVNRGGHTKLFDTTTGNLVLEYKDKEGFEDFINSIKGGMEYEMP